MQACPNVFPFFPSLLFFSTPSSSSCSLSLHLWGKNGPVCMKAQEMPCVDDNSAQIVSVVQKKGLLFGRVSFSLRERERERERDRQKRTKGFIFLKCLLTSLSGANHFVTCTFYRVLSEGAKQAKKKKKKSGEKKRDRASYGKRPPDGRALKNVTILCLGWPSSSKQSVVIPFPLLSLFIGQADDRWPELTKERERTSPSLINCQCRSCR